LIYPSAVPELHQLVKELFDRIDRLEKTVTELRIDNVALKADNASLKSEIAERLIREKDAVLAFVFNEEAPFTNNLAERDIRPAKVKQKISNCFRTFHGAEIYARIEGFVSTMRKQNQNVFIELCNTFEGHNFITNT